MSAGPLPPEKWLQEREWGRDLVHYSNDELDRLSMSARLQYAGLEEIGPYTIVFFHMFGKAGDYKETDNHEARALIHSRTEPETVIATLLADYLDNGRKSVRIKTDLFEPGPTVIEQVDFSYLEDQRTIYLSLDNCPGKTVNGGDVDGFIVSLDIMPADREEDDQKFLCILPMSKDLPERSLAPWPHLLIPLDEPELDIVELCLKWNELNEQRIKSLVQKWGLALDEPPGSAISTLSDLFFDPAETQNLREKSQSIWHVKKKVIALYEETKDEASRHMSENVESWIKTITGALSYLASNPDGRLAYEEGADPALVQKALANGTGARKAKQKLASAGYRSFTVYDGQGKTEEASQISPGSTKTAKSETGKKESLPPKKHKAGIDKRKAKRKSRRTVPSITTAITAPSTSQPDENLEKKLTAKHETPSPETVNAEDILPEAYQHRNPETGEDVAKDLAHLLRRCFKDTPDVGTRDWQSSIASAVSTMIVRRLKVTTAPRETIDAARKRIASEIESRISGLHSAQEVYDQHVVQHGGPAAWRFDAPSTLRPIDPAMFDDMREPVLIALDDDAELARMTAFPGIEPGTGGDHSGKFRVLLRLVFNEELLCIESFLYEGCLAGYRHVSLDPQTGEVQSNDAESDGDDAIDLADRAYAALADTIYGAVDFAEAWRYEQEHEIFRNQQSQQEPEDGNQGAIPKEGRATATEAKPAERAPAPPATSFRSWHNLTLPGSGFHLGTADAAEFILLCSGNAAAQSMANSLAISQEQSELHIAWRRHACSIVNSSGRLDSIDSPEISDEANLEDLAGREGILVVRDRAFFENITNNLVNEGQKAPGRSVIVLYRIDTNGFAAFALQTDEHGEIQFAQWSHAPLNAAEDDNDFVWYIRGALSAALPRDKNDVLPSAAATLPSMRREVRQNRGLKRQGAKRIIAQTRIYPENIATALSVVVEWFSEQVQRHGDNLVADRREEGDWTLEHVSHDRGMTNFWSVTVRTPDDHSNAIDIIVQTTLATGVQPRLPTLVRRIAERTPTNGPDGLLRTKPEYLTTKGEILSLVRDLQSPDRKLPILVMTQAEDGTYMRDPNEVAGQALGAVTVVKLPQNMTYELTDMLGQEYRTFGGAVRLFQPNFDPDTDPAHRHPRIMPDTMAAKALSALISRATSATVTRYDIPDALRIVGRTEQEPAAKTIESEEAQKDEDASEVATSKSTTKAPAPTPVLEPSKIDTLEENKTPEAPEPDSDERAAEAVSTNAERQSDKDSTTATETVELSEPDTVLEEVEASKVGEKTRGDKPEDEKTAEVASPETPAASAIDPAELATLVSNVVDQRLKVLGLGDLQSSVAQVLAKLDKLSTPAAPEPVRVIDDAEIEALRLELKAERETLNELLDEADAERRAAVAQVQTLRQALNDQRRQAHAKKDPDYPKDLSGLSDWLDRNVLPNVVITSKAWRNMRKVDYRDMERLCETLKLLDGAYIDMRAGEDGAREEWEAGLEKLRLQDRKQTKMGVAAREGDYHFRHQGEVYLMDRHLRGTESIFNDHSRLLRIYYHYNQDERLVLIGHLPTHLTTKDS